MVFRGQKRFWIDDMTLETKIMVKLIILFSMSPKLIDHIPVGFLSLIVPLSLYLQILAHLSQSPNMSYRNRWMSLFHRQQIASKDIVS